MSVMTIATDKHEDTTGGLTTVGIINGLSMEFNSAKVILLIIYPII